MRDVFSPLLLAELREFAPSFGVILGSGFGGVADRMRVVGSRKFSDVGGIPTSSVAGHGGRLVWGELGGRRLVVSQGRVHLYEGHSASDVCALVRLMGSAGVDRLVVTNAAGAIHPDFEVGGLMLISDHLNLTGASPLSGEGGFVDMCGAYSPDWRSDWSARVVAVGSPVFSGVYAGVHGPQYETPAEVRMLAAMGADAVGMSTVLEVIQARALGMQVLGVSCLTNRAAGLPGAVLDHSDVVRVADAACDAFTSILAG